MSVRCLVYKFDFSRLVSWWAIALYLAILKPSRKKLLHRESKCGQEEECQCKIKECFGQFEYQEMCIVGGVKFETLRNDNKNPK